MGFQEFSCSRNRDFIPLVIGSPTIHSLPAKYSFFSSPFPVYRRGRRFSSASQSALGWLLWADLWFCLQILRADAFRTQPLLFRGAIIRGIQAARGSKGNYPIEPAQRIRLIKTSNFYCGRASFTHLLNFIVEINYAHASRPRSLPALVLRTTRV
jgi:hypothetical protein